MERDLLEVLTKLLVYLPEQEQREAVYLVGIKNLAYRPPEVRWPMIGRGIQDLLRGWEFPPDHMVWKIWRGEVPVP